MQKESENDSLAYQIALKADSLFQLAGSEPIEEKGDCSYLLGLTSYNIGLDGYSVSINHFQSADSIYRAIGNIGKAADARVWTGNAVWYRHGTQAATPILDEAISMAESDDLGTRRFRGKYYADRAYVYVYQYDFEKAEKLLEKAIQLDMDAFGLYDKRTLNTLKIKSDNYLVQEDFYAAGKVLEEILEGFQEIYPPDHRNMAVMYGNLGNVNFQLGNLIGAKGYLEKTFEIFSQKLPPNHPNNIILYSKFTDLYNNLGDYDEAKKWNNLAVRNVDESSEYFGIIKMGQGLVSHSKGEYRQATELYEEAMPYILRLSGDSSIAVANLLETMGANYTLEQQFQKAEQSLEKALTYYQYNHGMVHPSCARTNSVMSELWLAKGQPKKALAAMENGIAANGGYQSLHSFEGNPDTWLALLGNKAETLTMIGNSQETSHWAEALSTIEHLDNYLDELKSLYDSPQEIQFLNKGIRGIYENAVHLCYLLHHESPSELISKALYFGEKSKNYRLLESLQRTRFSGLKEFQQQQDRFQALTYYYQQLKATAENAQQNKYQNYISEFQDSIKSLRQNLRYENPALFADLMRIEYVDPAQIQESLDGDETLINYFLTDFGLYGLTVTTDTTHFFLLDQGQDISEKISHFRYVIYEDFLKAKKMRVGLQQNATAYTEAGFELYQLLLEPMHNLLKKQVVIITDGVLGYLPFEATLTKRPAESNKFFNHDYFLNEHSIGYHFSATLWYRQKMAGKKEQKKNSLSVSAFAPFCTSDTIENTFFEVALKSGKKIVFDRLKHSRSEVENIVELFEGNPYYGQDASIDRFIEQCSLYSIVHLSTHGFANYLVENDAYLLFADPDSIQYADRLFLNEIASMRISADLVVISACESGVGTLDEGEGIISLARAFTHAGAKSLLKSLWSVDDYATSNLMEQFYMNLNAGSNKAEALQEAKKRYIRSVRNPEQSHPYFWSGFVLNGSNVPLR